MKTNQLVKTWGLSIAAILVMAACGDKAAPAADKKADGTAAPAGSVELTISCGSVGQDAEICKKNVDEWAAKTGNKVKLYSDPKDSSEKLALFRQQFGAGASDVDVLMVDVVWPGILIDQLWDLKEAE